MRLMCLPGPIQIGQICQVFTDNLTILYVSLLWEVEGQKKVSCQGSSGGGEEKGGKLSPPPPPQKKEGRREGRGEREGGGRSEKDVEPEGSNIIHWEC